MSIVKLTQQIIDNELHCPDGKTSIELCDRGLYVEVRSSCPGQGTYYLRYKDSTGKTCHQKIGRTTDIDLADARKKAKQLKAEIALGANPRGEAKAQKEVPTLDSFFDQQYLPHIRVHKRSWKRDVELYARLRPVFGGQRLNQISRQRMQQFHASLVETDGLQPATADHVMKVARRMLNLAIEWQVLTGPNVLSRIKLFNPDNRVDRHLNSAQLARLMAVLESDPNRTSSLAAKFLLATGCRLNEALSAKWSQVDRANGTWSIPAANSKSRRIRSVPLSRTACDVLDQLQTEGVYDYLFVNRRTGKRFVSIAKSWLRVREKAGLPNVRLHDLRHTFASLLINAGETLYVVKHVLGHSDTRVTERYAHLSQASQKKAANAASLAIEDAKPKAA